MAQKLTDYTDNMDIEREASWYASMSEFQTARQIEECEYNIVRLLNELVTTYVRTDSDIADILRELEYHRNHLACEVVGAIGDDLHWPTIQEAIEICESRITNIYNGLVSTQQIAQWIINTGVDDIARYQRALTYLVGSEGGL